MSVIVFWSVLFGGCASLPSADPALDKQAKTFSVPQGKSAIYLYRNEIFGAAVALPVSLDGQAMGKTGAKTYFRWEVQPGQHEVVSGGESGARLSLTTEPNKAYFVWQEVKLGVLSAGAALHQVDEQTGKHAVLECSLLASASSVAATPVRAQEKAAAPAAATPVPASVTAQNTSYPHVMNAAEIQAHYAQYHEFDASHSRRAFSLSVMADGKVKRKCPTCNVIDGYGQMTIKAQESLVCFEWDVVTYPQSGCFKIEQLTAETYLLRHENGKDKIEYQPVR